MDKYNKKLLWAQGVSDSELVILEEQLDPEELFLVGFLKGFNRKNMMDWNEKELWN